jgi:hypothetical protein
LWIWFGFAAVMLPLMIITQARYQTLGLCFLSWCGGIAFTLMLQERTKRRRKERNDYH